MIRFFLKAYVCTRLDYKWSGSQISNFAFGKRTIMLHKNFHKVPAVTESETACNFQDTAVFSGNFGPAWNAELVLLVAEASGS